jgi:hypothetical protein
MVHHLVACLLGQLLRHTTECRDIDIDDFPAFRTDEMRMRVGTGSVVSMRIVGKAKLHDLAHLFEEMDCLVDGGKACGRKSALHLAVNLLRTGVLVTHGKNLRNGQPLRGETIPFFLQPLNYLLEAAYGV